MHFDRPGVWTSLASAVAIAAAVWVPAAAANEPARETRLAARTPDGQVVTGRVEAFDAEGFDLVDGEGETHRLTWEQLGARRALDAHRKLLAADDGEGWLRAAAMLRELPQGTQMSEAALARAERADASLKDQADAVRRGEGLDNGDAADGDAAAIVEDGLASGPRISGDPQAKWWGDLSDEVQGESIAELKKFAVKTQETLDRRLAPYETEFFLFYSDLEPREAVGWARLLDKMYVQMMGVFGLDKDRNLFRGKALVFVFQQEPVYHAFQAKLHNTSSAGTAGMCHGFGNGYVHVAFFRKADDNEFAHVLVHETVHGFLHRYRSPKHIPTWVNEGLAEYVAGVMVPKSRLDDALGQRAVREMTRRGDLGGMFTAQRIEPWQYGAARLLTDFMIRADKRRYAAFIDGIKDGLTWEQSLKEKYGVELERLVDAFGREHNIRGLKP